MAGDIKQINGHNFLKCKECRDFKAITNDNWYGHTQGFMGVLSRCKECIKNGRKTEKELSMSRKRDTDRYRDNDRRRLYCVWSGMNARCYNKLNKRYSRYGGRGIIVERDCFDSFYRDIIEIYIDYYNIHGKDRKNCQLDRIDNNGNYSKENCRFITSKENNNNR